jgi:hypothetical protein
MRLESYSFTLSAPLTLGSAETFEMVGAPDVTMRPRRVLVNWREGGSVEVDSFRCGNVEVFIGYPLDATRLDAPIVIRRSLWYRVVRFFRRLLGQEVEPDVYHPPLDLPIIGPNTPVRIRGRYDGTVPPGRREGESYALMISVLGAVARRGGG